jgi:hypothetical protein
MQEGAAGDARLVTVAVAVAVARGVIEVGNHRRCGYEGIGASFVRSRA